jgi:hypothetical protein
MSYGIVRVQKMHKGGVQGIDIHDRRKKVGVSHSNKDIDWERSSNNYDLHTYAPDIRYHTIIKKRIGELDLKKSVRKDAVVMAQVLVTSDHEFFKTLSMEQIRCFFADSYDFLIDRYGQSNVISAIVHMDERTPHMHFNFVPVTADGRLCAKEVLTKQSLVDQQDCFQDVVGSKWGLLRGIQGGKKKHLEMTELKERTATQEAFRAHDEAKALLKCSKALESKIEVLESKIERLAFGEKDLERKIVKLKDAVKVTEQNVNPSILQKMRLCDELKVLKAENDRLNHKCEVLSEIVSLIPEDIKQKISENKKAQEQTKTKDNNRSQWSER